MTVSYTHQKYNFKFLKRIKKLDMQTMQYVVTQISLNYLAFKKKPVKGVALVKIPFIKAKFRWYVSKTTKYDYLGKRIL